MRDAQWDYCRCGSMLCFFLYSRRVLSQWLSCGPQNLVTVFTPLCVQETPFIMREIEILSLFSYELGSDQLWRRGCQRHRWTADIFGVVNLKYLLVGIVLVQYAQRELRGVYGCCSVVRFVRHLVRQFTKFWTVRIVLHPTCWKVEHLKETLWRVSVLKLILRRPSATEVCSLFRCTQPGGLEQSW